MLFRVGGIIKWQGLNKVAIMKQVFRKMWDVFLFLLTQSSSRGNLLHLFSEIMLLPGFLPINTSLATLFVLSEELILLLSFNCLSLGFCLQSSSLHTPSTLPRMTSHGPELQVPSAGEWILNLKPRSASWALDHLFLPSFPKYLLSF